MVIIIFPIVYKCIIHLHTGALDFALSRTSASDAWTSVDSHGGMAELLHGLGMGRVGRDTFICHTHILVIM